MNQINISISNLPPQYLSFVEDTIAHANANGVTVFLSADRGVLIQEGTEANGFFTDENHADYPLTLAAACGQSLDSWFPVFVHESSHMDQYFEDSPLWTGNKVKGYDAWDIVDLWMDGLIELNSDQLKQYVGAARDLELDCEMRSVKKINQYNLPIDVSRYIKTANAYVLFYNIMMITKKWYTLGEEPYNNEAIVEAMPDSFCFDFNNPPQVLIDLMLKELNMRPF